MSAPSREARLLALWDRLGRIPGGRRLFGMLLGRTVPYSGTTKPRVIALEPGRAVISMRDRRAVRNHLGSIHAVALANVGELASGLAMTAALAPSVRAIVTRLDITYHKKARGTLTAEGRASPPSTITEPVEVPAEASITDPSGDLVSTVTVSWLLGPRLE